MEFITDTQLLTMLEHFPYQWCFSSQDGSQDSLERHFSSMRHQVLFILLFMTVFNAHFLWLCPEFYCGNDLDFYCALRMIAMVTQKGRQNANITMEQQNRIAITIQLAQYNNATRSSQNTRKKAQQSTQRTTTNFSCNIIFAFCWPLWITIENSHKTFSSLIKIYVSVFQGVDETTSLVWYLSKQIWKTKSTTQDSLLPYSAIAYSISKRTVSTTFLQHFCCLSFATWCLIYFLFCSEELCSPQPANLRGITFLVLTCI